MHPTTTRREAREITVKYLMRLDHDAMVAMLKDIHSARQQAGLSPKRGSHKPPTNAVRPDFVAGAGFIHDVRHAANVYSNGRMAR